MNISGIVVTTAPASVPDVAVGLAALPCVEVAQVDAAGGRIVVVQERASVADEMEGLRAIQRVPGVVSADLVVHYFGDEERPPALPVAELARRLEPREAGVTSASVPNPNPDSWRSS
ncbi:MAG TPA: chaperone NapD [Burkholderiaceae bacterium]|nr:chaperone NapD [Burkholderiaceae bacterium]